MKLIKSEVKILDKLNGEEIINRIAAVARTAITTNFFIFNDFKIINFFVNYLFQKYSRASEI